MIDEEDFRNVKYTGTNNYIANEIWSDPNHLKSLLLKVLGISIGDDFEYEHTKNGKVFKKDKIRYNVIAINDDLFLYDFVGFDYAKNNINIPDFLINKSMCYLSNCYPFMYENGESYYDKKFSFVIWILNSKLPSKKGIDVYSFNNNKVEIDTFKLVFVSLPNVRNDIEIEEETKEFLGVLTDKNLFKYRNSKKEIYELAKTISHSNNDSIKRENACFAELAEITRKSRIALGFKEGKEQGLKEGKEHGLKETLELMVINLYKNGASLDLISKSSQKTEEEIVAILKKNNIEVY